MKRHLKQAWGYQGDGMNLPVGDARSASRFYEDKLGFTIVSATDGPPASAILERDGIRIQLVENGGDPTQDGCAFEVESIDELFSELLANGLMPNGGDAGTISPEVKIEKRDDGSWRVFFVVAPDGLCYWFGEKQSD